MNFKLITTPCSGGPAISQELYAEFAGEKGIRGIRTRIFHHIIDLADEQIKAALNQLGWRHDSEEKYLLVPNALPSDAPAGTPVDSHHVTIADVQKMEQQLRTIAKALNL